MQSSTRPNYDFTLSTNEYQLSASRNLEFIFHFPGCLLPLSFKRTNLSIPVHYTDNLLNIASVTTKNIGFLLMLSTSATTQRKITWRSRINFKDF